MQKVTRFSVLLLSLTLFAACSGDDGTSTSTTAVASGGADRPTTTVVASAGGTDADTAVVDTTTTTAATDNEDPPEPVTPTFNIVSRVPGDDGDTVVVLLDPDSYERLTDIDLQNVLANVIETFPPILEAHLVDSENVVDLVTAENVSAAEQRLLDLHYLARLDEGFRVTFAGPFEANGTTIIGS